MRTKVKAATSRVGSAEAALTRMLQALERELIDASDEEILEAAKDLGMDPRMRESAAFAGIKYPAKPQLSDFFDLEECQRLQLAAERVAKATPLQPKRRTRRLAKREASRERKNSRDE